MLDIVWEVQIAVVSQFEQRNFASLLSIQIATSQPNNLSQKQVIYALFHQVTHKLIDFA